jgi:hypothetical protein
MFLRANVPGLSPAQWARLAPFFAAPGEVDPEHVSVCTGVETRYVLAILLKLHTSGDADLFWGIYHCDEGEVARRRFEDGFQPTPWACPRCKATTTCDALRYELKVSLRNAITL